MKSVLIHRVVKCHTKLKKLSTCSFYAGKAFMQENRLCRKSVYAGKAFIKERLKRRVSEKLAYSGKPN